MCVNIYTAFIYTACMYTQQTHFAFSIYIYIYWKAQQSQLFSKSEISSDLTCSLVPQGSYIY